MEKKGMSQREPWDEMSWAEQEEQIKQAKTLFARLQITDIMALMALVLWLVIPGN